jgi:3-methyl-2-oxobutanoate hydroxymethyltransferase
MLSKSPADLATEFSSRKSRGEKIAVLTAYDYPLARLIDESGVDLVLVGDTVGMVVLGFPDTTHVRMEHMIHHCAAAARGVKNALLVCDLPFLSYESPAQAIENAQQLIAAGANAVKLEGGVSKAAEIRAITDEGIPVVGHIGMLPQHVLEEGGYKRKGRTAQEADLLLADARAVESAGAFAIVLELVFAETAALISRELRIPTIGIASGPQCDGQVLVTHDLIGLFPWFRPKFVTPAADVSTDISRAAAEFVRRTKA